jgi:hypothetical protein
LLPKQGGRINYLKAALGMLRMPRYHLPTKEPLESRSGWIQRQA